MADKQRHSNREAKKPKKTAKKAPATASTFMPAAPAPKKKETRGPAL